MTAHRLGLKASPKSGDYFFSFEVILILLIIFVLNVDCEQKVDLCHPYFVFRLSGET